MRGGGGLWYRGSGGKKLKLSPLKVVKQGIKTSHLHIRNLRMMKVQKPDNLSSPPSLFWKGCWRKTLSFFGTGPGLSVLAGLVLAVVGYITGCQDAHFSTIAEADCEDISAIEGASCEGMTVHERAGTGGGGADSTTSAGNDGSSVGTSPSQVWPRRVTLRTRLGRVNVLFVVDDSPSMKGQMKALAGQFDDFLETLKKVDYRIGLLTMDTSGSFVQFANGDTFLSNPNQMSSIHRDNVEAFKNTLRDMSENPQGSDDERGIYAVNQALYRGNGFFRQQSLLMVIFVSDEDERSYGGQPPRGFDTRGQVIRLETDDEPGTLFERVNSIHQSVVTLVSHAIIIKPGDTDCLNQSGGHVKNVFEGHTYAAVVNPDRHQLNKYGNIRSGKLVSICEKNYGSQLGSIADYFSRQGLVLTTHCVPVPDSISLYVEEDRTDFELSGRQVKITELVPFGAEAELRYRCL